MTYLPSKPPHEREDLSTHLCTPINAPLLCVHSFPTYSLDSGFGVSYSLNDVGSKSQHRKVIFVLSTTTRPVLGQPSRLFHGYWHSVPGIHELGHEVTIHHHLLPRLRMSWATSILLFPLYAFKKRDNSTLTSPYLLISYFTGSLHHSLRSPPNN
jgi:hypothetical protein